MLVKAPPGAPLGPALTAALERSKRAKGVAAAPDVDPYDLM